MSKKYLIITGGAGFIGSNLLKGFNDLGEDNILIVDSLGHSEKWRNLLGKSYSDYCDKTVFIDMVKNGQLRGSDIKAIFHLGACSTTTEKDADYLINNNTLYTRDLAIFAMNNDIRFYYASSAATYGGGENGYDDDESKLALLKPKNMYGYSKHVFDLWAYREKWLDKITGLKFFNVYGPNESHKKGMTSIVYNAYRQIIEKGMVKLFKSDNPSYNDGEQERDFIYVKDVVNILLWFYDNPGHCGIYNLGRGETTTWKNMTECVFKSLNKNPDIEYIDMPDILKGKYQYHTLANMDKLKAICPFEYTSFEDSINDYVKNYLITE